MILLVVIFGFLLRLINLNQSLWLDEGINVLAVKNNSLWGLLTQYLKADFHPPLHFIILWVWTRLFGFSEISVRFPSVIFGVLTIFIIYLICKKLFSKKIAIVSSLFLAINPLHIYYSQEARMYSLAAFAVSLNILLFIKLFRKEKINPAILILSSLSVLSVDYVAYFIFPVQIIFLIINRNLDILKKWFLFFLISCSVMSLWIPIFFSQMQNGVITSNALPMWKSVVGAFSLQNLGLVLIKFIIGRISYPDKAIYYGLLLPITSIFLYLLIQSYRSIKKYQTYLFVLWLTIPIIFALLISITVPIFSYFRLLFVLPSFIILTTLGIFSLKSKLLKSFLVIVIFIQISSSLIYLLNSEYHREDWKGLAEFINLKKGKVLFESSGVFSSFEYYSSYNMKSIGALNKLPAKNIEDLIDLKSYLNNSQDIYLADYLVEITDPNRLVDKQLIALGYKKQETVDFRGVGFLFHYVK